MRRNCRFITLASLTLIILSVSGATAATPRGSITIDRIADIKYPTRPSWSPDGKTLAFLWDSAGRQNLFAVKPGSKPLALSDFAPDSDMLLSDIGEFAWLSNSELLFGKDGQLYSVSLASPKPARVPGLDGAGNFSLSSDRKQIVYVRQGQVWIASMEAKSPRLLLPASGQLMATRASFSPDGKYVAISQVRGGLEPEPLKYNGDLVRLYRNVTWESRTGIISVFGGNVTWIPTAAERRGAASQWTADGSLLYQEMSPDRKDRSIKAASPRGEIRTLWTDHDDAWWSPTGGARTVVSPDGKWVVFCSDRSGWIHLYVTPSDAKSESAARQLTTGKFTANYPTWMPDSKSIVYSHSVEGNQMELFLASVAIDGSSQSAKAADIVKDRGVNFDPVVSPDGSTLAYSRTTPEHSLEIYAAGALPGGAKPIRLTDSMPNGMLASDLTAPVPVEFKSRFDGKSVPSTLIVHKTLDKTKKHPAIIWIHGSGSDQNYLGWHPGSYRMYYSIHQYLAQQGYVILTPDYRGSSGYSRDWATGVHMSLGISDAADVASGADYLKTLSYVDPDRIGVWGLSYGGFLTLQAVTLTPKLYRAAINVAGVADWEPRDWVGGSGGYTAGRLGTPEANPQVYDLSAPVRHLEKLERPLMILHGTNDANVDFRDSLAVIDGLMKLGKSFEMAIYPGEIHFFRRAHVLKDAWKRAEDFFDAHLKIAPVLRSESGGQTTVAAGR